MNHVESLFFLKLAILKLVVFEECVLNEGILVRSFEYSLSSCHRLRSYIVGCIAINRLLSHWGGDKIAANRSVKQVTPMIKYRT